MSQHFSVFRASRYRLPLLLDSAELLQLNYQAIPNYLISGTPEMTHYTVVSDEDLVQMPMPLARIDGLKHYKGRRGQVGRRSALSQKKPILLEAVMTNNISEFMNVL